MRCANTWIVTTIFQYFDTIKMEYIPKVRLWLVFHFLRQIWKYIWILDRRYNGKWIFSIFPLCNFPVPLIYQFHHSENNTRWYSDQVIESDSARASKTEFQDIFSHRNLKSIVEITTVYYAKFISLFLSHLHTLL